MTAGLVCQKAAEEMATLADDDKSLLAIQSQLDTPSELSKIDHAKVMIMQLDAPDIFDLYAGIYHTTFGRMIAGISLRKHYLETEGSGKADREIPAQGISSLAMEVADETRQLAAAIRHHRARLGLAL